MIIRSTDRRRVETPNAAMVTLASPTQGGAASSVWLVDMPGDITGPWHAFGGEVVWSIMTGDAGLELAGGDGGTADATVTQLAAGDTAILPAGRLRRLISGPAGFHRDRLRRRGPRGHPGRRQHDGRPAVGRLTRARPPAVPPQTTPVAVSAGR